MHNDETIYLVWYIGVALIFLLFWGGAFYCLAGSKKINPEKKRGIRKYYVLFLMVTIFWYAYNIWPSSWKYQSTGYFNYRTNRQTGVVEVRIGSNKEDWVVLDYETEKSIREYEHQFDNK